MAQQQQQQQEQERRGSISSLRGSFSSPRGSFNDPRGSITSCCSKRNRCSITGDRLFDALWVVAGQGWLPKAAWALSQKLQARLLDPPTRVVVADAPAPPPSLPTLLATRDVVELVLRGSRARPLRLQQPLHVPLSVRRLELASVEGTVHLPPALRSLSLKGLDAAATGPLLLSLPDTLEDITLDCCLDATPQARLPPATHTVRLDFGESRYLANKPVLSSAGLPEALQALHVRGAAIRPACRLPAGLHTLALDQCEFDGDFVRGTAAAAAAGSGGTDTAACSADAVRPWLPSGLKFLLVYTDYHVSCLGALPRSLETLFARPAACVTGAGAKLPPALRKLKLSAGHHRPDGAGSTLPPDLHPLPAELSILELERVPWALPLPPRLEVLSVYGEEAPPLGALPPTLRALRVCHHAHALPPLPHALEALELYGFAHALPPLPPALRALELGWAFAHAVALPPRLARLSVEADYDHPLRLPSALRALRVGWRYVSPLPPLPCEGFSVPAWTQRHGTRDERRVPAALRWRSDVGESLADLERLRWQGW